MSDEQEQYVHLAYGLSHDISESDLLGLTESRCFVTTKYDGPPISVRAVNAPNQEPVTLILRPDEVMLSFGDIGPDRMVGCLRFICSAHQPVKGRRTRRFRCRVELFVNGKGRLYRSTYQGLDG